MKKITIEGLTPYQCDMLDKMWSLKSTEEFTDWIQSLSTKELKMAIYLKEVLVSYYLDDINDYSDAKDYLKKYRL